MPAYSDYSYKFGGSDYVLSFDFEYTNTRERDIAAADFDGTFSFSDLSGMKIIVAETIDQKSIESSFIIESNETRVVHLITNVPENLQQAQLSVNFGGKEFTANFDCEVNKIIPKELSFGGKQVVSKHGEITLVDLYIDSSIYPKNPSRYYRYYEANPGKTFVIGEFKVKNLDTVAIHPNYLITGLVKADGYEFEGTCAISVDGDSSLESTRLLDPLNETTAYFLAEIPEELKTANNITLSIRFYGEDYIASMP